MIRFGESFDWATGTSQTMNMWTSERSLGVEFNGPKAGKGRFGTNGFEVSTWQFSRLGLTLDQQQTWIVGFAFNMAGAVSTSTNYIILALHDQDTRQCYLQLNKTDRTLSAYRGDGTLLGTSTVSLTENAYAYLEVKVKVHGSTGTFEIRKDEVAILTLTGINTQVSGNNQANRITIVEDGPGFPTCYYDDIYICDTSGLVNKDYLGNTRVEALFPNGPGTFAQWGRVDTALTNTQNWQSVDETSPNSDTDYNVGSAVGQRDTYSFTDPVSDSQIYGVVTDMFIRKEYAGTRNVTPVIYLSGTAYFGGTVYFGSDYQYAQQVFEYNPNAGTAWTFAAIGSAEFGIQIIQP